MRILGVDFGDARTGIALSDVNGFLASPLTTVEGRGLQKVAEEVSRLAAENGAEKIVIGFPKNMNGTLGPRAERTRQFGDTLSALYAGEIIYVDERMTTVGAHQIMNETNTRGAKRKATVDKLAAALILQTYLDSHR